MYTRNVESPKPKKGDILFSRLGTYNTEIRYYMVIKTYGKSVVVAELEKTEIDVYRDDRYPASLKGKVLPTETQADGLCTSYHGRYHPHSKTEYSVSLNRYETAYTWHGEALHFSKVI